MKLVATLVLAAAGFAIGSPAFAQFAKPEDAVKYRQSVMFVMAQHFGRVGAMANGRVPFDGKAATDNAEIVAEMARLPWPAFTPNTDKMSQKAKSEIFSEQAKFKDHGDTLPAETVKLVAAAKTNNLDNLKAQFGNTAATCKACHDNYRNQ
jgi:cytochrome c556